MCRGSEEGGRGTLEELSLIPQNLYKSSQAQWHL